MCGGTMRGAMNVFKKLKQRFLQARRNRALDKLIAEWEKEDGPFTEEEMEIARRELGITRQDSAA
jgi:hypothetical protein